MLKWFRKKFQKNREEAPETPEAVESAPEAAEESPAAVAEAEPEGVTEEMPAPEALTEEMGAAEPAEPEAEEMTEEFDVPSADELPTQEYLVPPAENEAQVEDVPAGVTEEIPVEDEIPAEPEPPAEVVEVDFRKERPHGRYEPSLTNIEIYKDDPNSIDEMIDVKPGGMGLEIFSDQVEPDAEPELEAEPEPEIEPEPEAEPEIEATPEPVAAAPEKKKGFFARLRDRLSRTRSSLIDSLLSLVGMHGKLDEELLEQIEDLLIQSDVGVQTAIKIVGRMREEAKKDREIEGDAVVALFKQSIEEILTANQRALDFETADPFIMLVVGVNGTGKTTTIGKIGKVLADQGKNVMMVAADTFRAAAADQLQIWAERTGSCIVRQEEGADPAAVVYEALEGAKRGPHPDVILIDTAGRLHTKKHLMAELSKIGKIIKRHYPDAPHETVIVVDATTGQNALSQLKIFNEATELSGMIMTKMDGTAKGGILVSCKDAFGLPVFKIGIGEQVGDLRDFDAHEFVEALFGEMNA